MSYENNLYIGNKLLTQENLEDFENTVVIDLKELEELNNPDIATFDENNNLIINDVREDTNTTELHFPLNPSVKPGQEIEVTVSGKNWPGKGIRVWAVGSSDINNGSKYTENASSSYLNVDISEDNSYEGKVTIKVKEDITEECSFLTFKPDHYNEGNKIEGWVISSITVKYPSTLGAPPETGFNADKSEYVLDLNADTVKIDFDETTGAYKKGTYTFNIIMSVYLMQDKVLQEYHSLHLQKYMITTML